MRCPRCGATLSGTPVDLSSSQPIPVIPRNARSGMENPNVARWEADETDLHSGTLPRSGLTTIILSVVGLILIIAGAIYMYNRMGNDVPPQSTPTPAIVGVLGTGSISVTPGLTRQAPPPTNTRIAALVPTLNWPTVTPQPPTPTITPTRGPCVQTAGPQDTILSMAIRCGHKHMAVVAMILQINGLKQATDLKAGQKIEIPWPTPIGGGPAESIASNATGQPTSSGSDLGQEPTLLPSLMYYIVKKGDTAVSIIYNFRITMAILHDLNQDILRFEGCDYGLPAGGGSCIVTLAEGQRLRVPAPTPTPTKPPTPTGSETPTPTATPTFNAPFSVSPDNNMQFDVDLPTLRWTATAQLAPNQVYLITVKDTTANVVYYHTTTELSFQLPVDWQPTDGKRHQFEWKVNIAIMAENNKAIVTDVATETRTFIWIGR